MTWKCSASHNCRTYDIQRCFSKTILQSHCSHGKQFSKRPFEGCQGLLTEIRQIFYNGFSKYLERILSGKRDWLLVSKIIIFQTQKRLGCIIRPLKNSLCSFALSFCTILGWAFEDTSTHLQGVCGLSNKW